MSFIPCRRGGSDLGRCYSSFPILPLLCFPLVYDRLIFYFLSLSLPLQPLRLLLQLTVKNAARGRKAFFSYVVSGSGRIIFSLIYFSVWEHAWLQVDLLVLPYKEDFGSTLWAVIKAAAGPHMSGSG